MGFSFDEASWNVVTDIMFIGSGGPVPGFCTFLGIVGGIILLWACNRSERKKYQQHSGK